MNELCLVGEYNLSRSIFMIVTILIFTGFWLYITIKDSKVKGS